MPVGNDIENLCKQECDQSGNKIDFPLIHKHQQNITKKGKQHGQIYVRYRDLLFDVSGFEKKHPGENGHDQRFCNQDQLVKVKDNGKDVDECINPEEKYNYPICYLV
jgi:cytochrome b involved in lipid metabolism